MKEDFRSRYQKAPKGRFVQQKGQTSPNDILGEADEEIHNVTEKAKPFFRLIAFIIDFCIIALLLILATFAIEKASPDSIFSLTSAKKFLDNFGSTDLQIVLGWGAFFFIVSLFYYCSFEGSPLRASFGKILMGLSVTNLDGTSCSAIKAIFRNIYKIFSIISFGIGFLIVFIGSHSSLHDKLSSTQVSPIPNLSSTRRIIRFISLSFTSGVFVVILFTSSLIVANKPKVPQQQQEEIKIEEPTPTATPTPLPVGAYGSIKVDDTDFQINGVFLRNKPVDADDTLSNSIFDSVGQNYSNNIVIEMLFFDDSLNKEDIKKLQVIYDVLNESESVIAKKAIARLEVAYDKDVEFCQKSNIQYANLILNKSFSSNNIEQNIPLVKGYADVNNSNSFRTSCKTISFGDYISLNTQGQSDLNGIKTAWRINAEATYLRYKLLGSSTYTNSKSSVAIFNETTNVMEVGFFDRKLTNSEIAIIRSNKSVKTSKLPIIPRAVGTIPITLPSSFNSIKNATITLAQRTKLLSLSADNVQKGFSIWFRNDGKIINIPGEKGELTVKYSSPQIPSTFGGILEEGRYVVGRFSGFKRIKQQEGVYKFSWTMSYNTKIICVK